MGRQVRLHPAGPGRRKRGEVLARVAPTGRCPWDQDRPSVQKDHYLFGSGLACMLHKSVPVGLHSPYTNTAWRANMGLLRRRIPRKFNELEKSDHMWTMWVMQREVYNEVGAAGSRPGHGISLHSKIGSDFGRYEAPLGYPIPINNCHLLVVDPDEISMARYPSLSSLVILAGIHAVAAHPATRGMVYSFEDVCLRHHHALYS